MCSHGVFDEYTVLFRGLRRVAPQRVQLAELMPSLAAFLVLSEFWRLLRLHGLFFRPV